MARSGLRQKAVSVYATEDQLEVLQKAAARETRSLSNFLIHEGLKRAEELGLMEPKKSRRAS